MSESAASYFKKYREKLGFTNQALAKEYLAAKNINPSVDYNYISLLNDRIIDIIERINNIIKDENSIRLEIQSGFQGINDIKQHKVLEAKRILNQIGDLTICIHFDLYNGQVAFVRLDNIEDNDINWFTIQQMEEQTVFSIDQNYFAWRLLEPIPNYEELKII